MAGLLDSHDAYRLSLGGKADEVKEGFSGDQRFFISFGQSWRSKIRDAEMRRQIATDGHAPEQYRAGTVSYLNVVVAQAAALLARREIALIESFRSGFANVPQIACFADHHYLVEKQESRGRTVAVIEELDAAARTREVGRMLSGQKLTPEALKNAEQLIKMSVG